ncbi:hypothetical protein LCGC14_0598430 [marine sediment metagenome]|uniref:Uncharacterized protein n=1 Tax=marine sediment metagenome TaxID=412755 RepID=A0A0F9RV38_9ZZZZ
MSDMMQRMGLRQEKGSFSQALFYFMREFKFNPLDEEYVIKIKWTKWFWKIKKPYVSIIKKGLTIPLFSSLMEEMQKHYKKEEAEMKRARRR